MAVWKALAALGVPLVVSGLQIAGKDYTLQGRAGDAGEAAEAQQAASRRRMERGETVSGKLCGNEANPYSYLKLARDGCHAGSCKGNLKPFTSAKDCYDILNSWYTAAWYANYVSWRCNDGNGEVLLEAQCGEAASQYCMIYYSCGNGGNPVITNDSYFTMRLT